MNIILPGDFIAVANPATAHPQGSLNFNGHPVLIDSGCPEGCVYVFGRSKPFRGYGEPARAVEVSS